MIWSYGVTTVPERLEHELPTTLESLAYAGFCQPRLFVDNSQSVQPWQDRFGLEVTCYYPRLQVSRCWLAAAIELYIRQPSADRYAIFQDDLLACKNLRAYLERQNYPEKGYLNLYTFPHNEAFCKSRGQWWPSDQMGKGAVGLVFDREAFLALLTSPHIYTRLADTHRGWRSINGGIVTALQQAGYKEYVHTPSLLQHMGLTSVVGNARHPQAISYPGQSFDALSLL